MSDETVGKIDLKHDLNDDTGLEFKADTKGNIAATIDYKISQNSDIALTEDNRGNTTATLTVKF